MTIGETTTFDWKIVTTVAVIAISWGMLMTTVQSLKEQVAPIPQLQQDVSTVKSDVAWIKSTLGTEAISSR